MARRRPIAVLGCGAVGRALALALAARGETLVLWSRTPARARRLARSLGARAGVATEVDQAGQGARSALLCVPEEVQPELSAELARSRVPILLTVSGALPLASLAERAPRARVGRFHPLVPVLARADARTFQGMPFGLEGVPVARREARRLVQLLGGFELALQPGHAERYHAGAALLGGGLVALLALADEALAPGVPAAAVRRRALVAFAARNLLQFERHGAVTALTGPIARGSEARVRAHLAALAAVPAARAAYRVLGLKMLALAGQRRGLARADLARVRRVLAE